MTIIRETAKDRILKIVHGQPDDSAFDEILQELALSRMIERGLDDSQNDRTISHEEMGQRISSWAGYGAHVNRFDSER